MTIDKEEKQHIRDDKRAHLGMIMTTVSTFILVVGLVWNQATWQASTTENISQLQSNVSQIHESVDENNKLIKLNTIRLSEVEGAIKKSVTREDLFHWLLELKENNPEIKVPLPPEKTN